MFYHNSSSKIQVLVLKVMLTLLTHLSLFGYVADDITRGNIQKLKAQSSQVKKLLQYCHFNHI